MTNRRIFLGTDPGTKGACGVLAVADCPADEARHGVVLAVDVFDLPVVERDNGGHDLDVVAFKVALQTALMNVVGDTGGATGCDGLVEYPVLSAGFGGGVRQKVQQGVNAGAVWAAMKATGLVQVGWVDSDKWRLELGGVEKGGEALAVMALRMTCPTHEGAMEFTGAVTADGQILNDARPDRLVAVLLAEVARRRWLGTACAPKKTGTARAAKARKADRRKEAIARAIAPLTVAKARVLAMESTWCPSAECHGDEDDSTTPPGAPCRPRNKCCEARLLEWAWQASLDLHDAPTVGTPLHAAVKDITTPGWHMYRRTSRSKNWTVETNGGVSTIPGEVGDALIDHGLVTLMTGTKDVEYARTPRGAKWSLRLLGVPTKDGLEDPADKSAP